MSDPDEDEGERADEPAGSEPARPRGVFWELLGCAIPLGVLLALVLLVMWGYRAVFSPGKPEPVEVGELRSLELTAGDGKEHAGRRCRVYAEWVAIDADGAVVLIPRDRVQALRLAPPR
jgi:hypothetical protein